MMRQLKEDRRQTDRWSIPARQQHFMLQCCASGAKYPIMQLSKHSIDIVLEQGATHAFQFGQIFPQARIFLQDGGDVTVAVRVIRLYETIDGAVKVTFEADLALDLSTLSAIDNGQFAQSHDPLGRNRPVAWLTQNDLTPEFFAQMMRTIKPHIGTITSAQTVDLPVGDSIITALTARKMQKLLGLFPYELCLTRAQSTEKVNIFLKIKPIDEEVMLMLNHMASMCEAHLASAFAKFKHQLGFQQCHRRELRLYQSTDQRFTRYTPKVYGMYENADREAYVLMLEYLQDVRLFNTANVSGCWRTADIQVALTGIAHIHSMHYAATDEVKADLLLEPFPHLTDMLDMQALWRQLSMHAANEFPAWFGAAQLERNRQLIKTLPIWWSKLNKLPTTMIHNDFNPRNVAIRHTPEGDRLCAYDWELACIGVPQHDLAEFLVFTLQAEVDKAVVDQLIEWHRKQLAQSTRRIIPKQAWRQGYVYCLYHLAIVRLPLYMMAHTFHYYEFMQRISNTLDALIALETDDDHD